MSAGEGCVEAAERAEVGTQIVEIDAHKRRARCAEAGRVVKIYGVVQDIRVNIRVAAAEEDRILARPASRRGVVIARAEAREAGVGIVEAAGETERLEARRGVGEDAPEFIVVEPLRDGSGARVHDEPHAVEMVRDEPVGDTAFHQVIRRTQPTAVDEAAHDGVAPVEFGGGQIFGVVEKAPRQRAVHALADAAALAVDDVRDRRAAGQRDAAQISERVVVVGRGGAAGGFGKQIARGGARVGRRAERHEAVLRVVGRGRRRAGAGGGSAVAVRVVAMTGKGRAVFQHRDEPPGGIVGEAKIFSRTPTVSLFVAMRPSLS